MVSETNPEADVSSGQVEDYASDLCSGAIFAGSHNFTVAGGIFTAGNVTTNYISAPNDVPSDFRRIPLCDIDLQDEIRFESNCGVVRRRRLHPAKIDRGTLNVTVAMYEGNGAKKEWQRDITKYMTMRHSSIIQLYGVASSGNTHATIFHDDLIPFQYFLDLYRHSPLSMVYIYAYTNTDFKGAQDYLSSIMPFRQYHDSPCTLFIRRSTGRFCVDLVRSSASRLICCKPTPSNELSRRYGLELLSTAKVEDAVVDTLTLEQFHQICCFDLSQYRYIRCTTRLPVNLGTVICCPLDPLDSEYLATPYLGEGQPRDIVEIATLPDVDISFQNQWGSLCPDGEIMENRWTRFPSHDVVDSVVGTVIWSSATAPHDMLWLSQANHVFQHLGISSNFTDYVVCQSINLDIRISEMEVGPPQGFLFVCPATDFQTGPTSFQSPDCPGYWSLDPSGVERLSAADAANLGFPSITVSMGISGTSWDTSAYYALKRFHQGKGFDPESQDVARHLGYKLYNLSGDTSIPNAYIDDEEPNEDGQSPVLTEEKCTDSVNESTVYPNQNFGLSRLAEEPPVSTAFTSVMNVQLALILFLGLFGLYG